jgi:hypothetical protein
MRAMDERTPRSELFTDAERITRAERLKPEIAGTADVEREARFDAARVTLEFGQKSARRLDSGRDLMSNSPLFGGPAQGGLFG